MNIIVKTTLEQAIEDLKMIANPDVKNFELNQLLSDDINIVLKEIERLTTELESANESITWWQNRFNAVEKDNERLNNIINELEKYIEESYKYNSKCLSTIFEARAFEDNKILDKLQELKGDGSNE